MSEPIRCPDCQGSGRWTDGTGVSGDCESCDGTGTLASTVVVHALRSELAAMTARAKAAEAAVERVRALAAKWLVFRSCIRERGDAETVRACGRALHTALEAPDAPLGS